MGIPGLLQFLNEATSVCHISTFRGATAVVDTYYWLYKGDNPCALPLLTCQEEKEDRMLPMSKYSLISYCKKFIKLLQFYDIQPILVFDLKRLANTTEAADRTAIQIADQLIDLDTTDGIDQFNVTPEIASDVIKECHKLGVDCIVAPYESIAQMAFFNLKGEADIVISGDSDLMLYGCSKMMYKLDQRGYGYLVEARKISLCMHIEPYDYTFDKFLYMCVLSAHGIVGYLPGVGLYDAAEFFRLNRETDPFIFLDKISTCLNLTNLRITQEYKQRFMKNVAKFKHELVFDPYEGKVVPLMDLEPHGTHICCINDEGKSIDSQIAYQTALGNFDMKNWKVLDDWSPLQGKLRENSIWSRDYHKIIAQKEEDRILKNTKELVIKRRIDCGTNIEHSYKNPRTYLVNNTLQTNKGEEQSENVQNADVTRTEMSKKHNQLEAMNKYNLSKKRSFGSDGDDEDYIEVSESRNVDLKKESNKEKKRKEINRKNLLGSYTLRDGNGNLFDSEDDSTFPSESEGKMINDCLNSLDSEIKALMQLNFNGSGSYESDDRDSDDTIKNKSDDERPEAVPKIISITAVYTVQFETGRDVTQFYAPQEYNQPHSVGGSEVNTLEHDTDKEDSDDTITNETKNENQFIKDMIKVVVNNSDFEKFVRETDISSNVSEQYNQSSFYSEG